MKQWKLQPIATIEVIHAALIWIGLYSAAIGAGFILRHIPSTENYYYAAIGLTLTLFLLVPLLGKKSLVFDIQEICLYDVFIQILGLILFQKGASPAIYLAASQMLTVWKTLRLTWPIFSRNTNLCDQWPTFGVLGLIRQPQKNDTSTPLSAQQIYKTYLLILTVPVAVFGLLQLKLLSKLPMREILTIACIFLGTRPLIASLYQREYDHNITQRELGIAEGVAAARAEMILELTTKNEKIEQQSIELAATNRQLEELAADLSRKNAELEAMALQQATLAQDLSKRNESLRNANHDLKQPITKLRFYTDRARTFATDETQTKFLHLVEAGLEELSSMMHSIINQAKISTQLVAPSIQDIKVADLINYFQESFFEMARERGSFFGQKEADCIIRSNEILLKRIISNLLNNAILHTPPGTLVYLSFQRNARECCIRVWDRGPGIVNANGPDRAYNFTSFIAQLKEDDSLDADSNSPDGHGLGLISVQRICDELRVTMTLKSIPGIGTVFRFCVPLAIENNK